MAFRFDKESLRPLWRLPLQQFAYRQLMYLVLIQSATTALTGGRLRWHKLHRAGLIKSTSADPARRSRSRRWSTPGRRCWTGCPHRATPPPDGPPPGRPPVPRGTRP